MGCFFMNRIFSARYRNRIQKILDTLKLDEVAVFSEPFNEEDLKSLADEHFPAQIFVPRSKIKRENIHEYEGILSASGDNIYFLRLNPSVTFSYPDRDTAELAYALMSFFSFPLSTLENIVFDEQRELKAQSIDEIKAFLSTFAHSSKVWVYFHSSSYKNPSRLASAFRNADYIVLEKEDTKEYERFTRALDSIIFSPLISRLSSVVEVDSFTTPLSFISPLDKVISINLEEKN